MKIQTIMKSRLIKQVSQATALNKLKTSSPRKNFAAFLQNPIQRNWETTCDSEAGGQPCSAPAMACAAMSWTRVQWISQPNHTVRIFLAVDETVLLVGRWRTNRIVGFMPRSARHLERDLLRRRHSRTVVVVSNRTSGAGWSTEVSVGMSD